MAMTREYLDLVENAIDIAPVGSQEEVQAAEFMLDAFTEHGLETELQDLTAPLYGRLITGIMLMVAMLAAVFCGLGGFGWAALGFLLALVAGAYLASEYLGMNPMANVGPVAESQNVIGIHRGEGARAGRGVRPIVVLARYDTGREELLAKPGLVSIAPLVWQVAPWCLAIVVVGALLQLFQIMGGPALLVLWIITMVCALPLLLLGLNEASAGFMSLTDGANDNKAALAAMLGVLEDVAPTDEERLKFRAAQMAQARAQARREAADDEIEYEEYEVEEREPVVGVRHGKRVLMGIGMLPATCSVEYVEPKTVVAVKRRPKPVPSEEIISFSGVISGGSGDAEAGAEAAAMDAAEAAAMAAAMDADGALDYPASGDTAQVRRVAEVNAVPGVAAGGDLASDAHWGEAEFEPGPSKRRALLFDLPDPSIESSDPLDSSEELSERTTVVVEGAGDALAPNAPRVDAEELVGAAVEKADGGRGLFSRLSNRGKGERGSKGRRRGGRRGRNAEVVDELVEESFDDVSGDDWLGGAARAHSMRDVMRRAEGAYFEAEAEDSGYLPKVEDAGEAERDLELVDDAVADEIDVAAEQEADVTSEQEAIASLDREEDEDGEPLPQDLAVIGAPADEKLRQAVLDMGDVNLVAHDIWFVCVGASSLRHMGTQIFVQAHRRELRGCFIINLDSIGAGNLSLLTTEGYGDTRRGDRKISRLFDTASKTLHVPLTMNEHNWEDTDVTPALRRSMRGITLMGTEGGKNRALANTAEDVLENIDANQVVYAAELVSEVIRRA